MSDRIAVMNKGRIEQVGSPTTIYERPASLFVAGFIGQCNVIAGTCSGMTEGRYQFVSKHGASFAVAVDPARNSLEPGRAVNLVVRPEAIQIGSFEADSLNRFSVQVEDAVYLGDKTGLLLRITDGPETLLAAFRGPRGSALPKPGETLIAQVDPSECVFVDDLEATIDG
jgi:ABC-type Fe3+/spermidine/putrescine transport system ATPase subunit